MILLVLLLAVLLVLAGCEDILGPASPSGSEPTDSNGTDDNGQPDDGQDDLTEIETHWFTGSTDPSPSLGSNGDLYMNTETGEVFVKTDGYWESSGNVTGPQGPEGPAGPGIEYWTYTIQEADTTYMNGESYGGYYHVEVDDSRFGPTDWIDIWKVADDGSWYRPAEIWDATLSVWYYILYTYDGSISFASPIDETGNTFVFFRAETTVSTASTAETSPTGDTFNAAEYFTSRVGRD
jgi:hypothetical protein